jgi:hypothetical protein
MVDDITPGVIVSEMPKLRPTTLTRVDLYLEPPPPPLVCPSRAVECRKKFVSVLLLIF